MILLVSVYVSATLQHSLSRVALPFVLNNLTSTSGFHVPCVVWMANVGENRGAGSRGTDNRLTLGFGSYQRFSFPVSRERTWVTSSENLAVHSGQIMRFMSLWTTSDIRWGKDGTGWTGATEYYWWDLRVSSFGIECMHGTGSNWIIGDFTRWMSTNVGVSVHLLAHFCLVYEQNWNECCVYKRRKKKLGVRVSEVYLVINMTF